MRKWVIGLLTIGFVAVMWNWSGAPGTWPDNPTASEYASGYPPQGTVVYNDILPLYTALKGAIGDTNIVEGAQIDLDKLEKGTMYHNEGYTAPKVVAYGDLNMHWANPCASYNLVDTLIPDSTYVFLIDFADSSDVGDPNFGATPHISLGPLSWAGSAVGVGAVMSYDHWRKNITDSLHYGLQWAGAGSCSVYVHYAGLDTVFNGVQLYWEAKQK